MTDQPQRIKVRTTMRPNEPQEVTRAEALDLQRQGLLSTDNRETRKLEEEAR